MNNFFDALLDKPILLISLFTFLFTALILLSIFFEIQRKRIIQNIEDEVLELMEGDLIDSDEFINLHNKISPYDRRQTAFSMFDFIGIYVIHNVSKEKFYIGQSQKALTRAWNVLDGQGNRFLYKDYLDGDEFELRFLSLFHSDFDTLTELKKFEKDNILHDFGSHFY